MQLKKYLERGSFFPSTLFNLNAVILQQFYVRMLAYCFPLVFVASTLELRKGCDVKVSLDFDKKIVFN